MNNNQIISKPKFNPGRIALISLVLGIVSTLPILWVIAGLTIIHIEVSDLTWHEVIFSIPAGIIAVFGLIFGIIGLWSTKKKLAITGIVLSVIGLLASLFMFYDGAMSLAA